MELEIVAEDAEERIPLRTSSEKLACRALIAYVAAAEIYENSAETCENSAEICENSAEIYENLHMTSLLTAYT
jgi:hypothetical protein